MRHFQALCDRTTLLNAQLQKGFAVNQKLGAGGLIHHQIPIPMLVLVWIDTGVKGWVLYFSVRQQLPIDTSVPLFAPPPPPPLRLCAVVGTSHDSATPRTEQRSERHIVLLTTDEITDYG